MTMQEAQIQHCGIVILAAGKSSRLGTAKQLLQYQGFSLIERTAKVALATGWQPVVVVVGANKDDVSKVLTGKDLTVVNNEGWEEGMASSLRLGLEFMQAQWPGHDGVLFLVCDQPFITPALLKDLLSTQHNSGKPLVASSYGGKLGTPALFHKSLFMQLLQLQGDTGARKLISQNMANVASVNFAEGAIDIDTTEDYDHLLNG